MISKKKVNTLGKINVRNETALRDIKFHGNFLWFGFDFRLLLPGRLVRLRGLGGDTMAMPPPLGRVF